MTIIDKIKNGETCTNAEILAEIDRLREIQSRMVGSLYPRIIDSEIEQLKAAIYDHSNS